MNLLKSGAIASTLALLIVGCGGGGGDDSSEKPVASNDTEFDLFGNNVKGSLVFGKDSPPNSGTITYQIKSIKANLCEGVASPVPATLAVTGGEETKYDFVMQFSNANGGNCITDKLIFDYDRIINTEELEMTPRTIYNPTYSQENVFREVGTDPLFQYQWHLVNTGQSTGVTVPATRGEDINVQRVWEEDRLTGNGVVVAVIDEGVDMFHPDLKNNLDPFISYNYHTENNNPTPVRYFYDSGKGYHDYSHGTAVAGLIGAQGWNSIGTRGVAPNATLASYNALEVYEDEAKDWYEANKIPRPLTNAQLVFYRLTEALNRNLTSSSGGKTIDIYNNSWGDTVVSLSYDYPETNLFDKQLRSGVREGRNGKGAIYVKSAGNNRAAGDFDNFDQMQTSGYFIVVAASGADGKVSRYSTPGSNLLVNAPGGDTTNAHIKTDEHMIVTTDLAGKERGLDSNIPRQTGNSHFDVRGNENYDYTQYMNGTSAAAPIVSGVVALMLEANPDLTWRDVRLILARSAFRNDPDSQTWSQNAAGLWYSSDYGFGRVDAKAAVDMARNFPSVGTFLNGMRTSNANGNGNRATINDNLTIEHVSIRLSLDLNSTETEYRTISMNGNGNARNQARLFAGENIFTVSSRDANTSTSVKLLKNEKTATEEDAKVVVSELTDINTTREVVDIAEDGDYFVIVDSNSTWSINIETPLKNSQASNIRIALTSPSGTQSVLVGAPNGLGANETYTNTRLSSVQFLDERSRGDWTLNVTDINNNSFNLTNWSLEVRGH